MDRSGVARHVAADPTADPPPSYESVVRAEAGLPPKVEIHRLAQVQRPGVVAVGSASPASQRANPPTRNHRQQQQQQQRVVYNDPRYNASDDCAKTCKALGSIVLFVVIIFILMELRAQQQAERRETMRRHIQEHEILINKFIEQNEEKYRKPYSPMQGPPDFASNNYNNEDSLLSLRIGAGINKEIEKVNGQ